MPTPDQALQPQSIAGFHPEVSPVHEALGPHGDLLTSEQKADIAANKDVAAMSYLWLLSVVIYYQRRDSPFIRYHAKQGIWLFALSIPVYLIPGIGHYLSFFTLAGMIIGFLNAAQGHYHDIPVIGKLARGTLTLSEIARKVFHHGRKAADAVKRGIVQKVVVPSPEQGKEREGQESAERTKMTISLGVPPPPMPPQSSRPVATTEL